MGYTDPNTVDNPTAGSVAPTAWGDIVRDDLQFLANPPKCRVYNSANISIATSGTPQALTFNSERFDTDSMHSTVSNTGRITFTTAGTYEIGAHVVFDPNSTGYRDLTIRLNGTTTIAYDRDTPIGGGVSTVMFLVSLWAFSAGDYIEVVVTQTSGGALNVANSANISPEFWSLWVSL